MSDNKIILVGYSGHGVVVAEAAKTSGLDITFYAERQELKSNPFSLKYLGFEGKDNFEGWNGDFDFILGIGDNNIRSQVANLIMSKQKNILNVIHHSSSIGQQTELGNGIFIARNVSINSLSTIGDFCILNTACIIEHECIIEHGAHIAPGAVLAGNVFVGQNTFVGANSVIKQNLKIGSNSLIGAGAVVINNIGNNEVWVGNPAKRIK